MMVSSPAAKAHVSHPKIRRGGRLASACLDCRRLKRKCDKQWPCNHCLARKVAHQCQFEPLKRVAVVARSAKKRKLGSSNTASTTDESTSSHQSDHASCSPDKQHQEVDNSTALKALGYVGSHVFTTIETGFRPPPGAAAPEDLPAEINQTLRTVPPRPYTDMLIRDFFHNVNYHYEAVHQPTFMRSYTDWWDRRRGLAQAPSMSDIAFTSLILQMCANAAQFIERPTLDRLESELGERVEDLSVRLYDAAQRLSAFVPPGEGGLILVQQLFLGGGWLKNRVEITKSWHLLAAAVREAQEVGMHVDSVVAAGQGVVVTPHEREMRRRMWYILRIWDTSMCGSFGRPLLIQEHTAVPPPSSRFDLAEGSPQEETSAAAVIILEYQLWQYLAGLTATAASEERPSLALKMKFVEDWIRSLPALYSAERQESRAGDEDPFTDRFRRLKLHCMGYMALLAYLRPYLTLSTSSRTDEHEESDGETTAARLAEMAVQTAVRLMHISQEFLSLCYPNKAKYFLVQFCPFDTASTLCSALLRDDPGGMWVPRREEVLGAIGCALHISDRLRGLTKMGNATWNILTTLVSQVDLSAGERQIVNSARRSGEFSSSFSSFPGPHSSGPTANLDSVGGFSVSSIQDALGPFTPVSSANVWGDGAQDTLFLGDDNDKYLTEPIGMVGVGYNISGIMALEEQINGSASEAGWTWNALR